MSQKISVDARRRLVSESLLVGNPSNNSLDHPGLVEVRVLHDQFERQMELAICAPEPMELSEFLCLSTRELVHGGGRLRAAIYLDAGAD